MLKETHEFGQIIKQWLTIRSTPHFAPSTAPSPQTLALTLEAFVEARQLPGNLRRHLLARYVIQLYGTPKITWFVKSSSTLTRGYGQTHEIAGN